MDAGGRPESRRVRPALRPATISSCYRCTGFTHAWDDCFSFLSCCTDAWLRFYFLGRPSPSPSGDRSRSGSDRSCDWIRLVGSSLDERVLDPGRPFCAARYPFSFPDIPAGLGFLQKWVTELGSNHTDHNHSFNTVNSDSAMKIPLPMDTLNPLRRIMPRATLACETPPLGHPSVAGPPNPLLYSDERCRLIHIDDNRILVFLSLFSPFLGFC